MAWKRKESLNFFDSLADGHLQFASGKCSIKSSADLMWECHFMIDLSQDIHSLSDFKRKTAAFMTQMKKSGRPVVLTINGRAELVVQDAAGYQHLLNLAEQAEMIEFLRESREDIEAGRTEPAIQALKRLAKKHKLRMKGP
jgi:PHD/YefM family antitoxin component YafN of YafNO toxin-antitoxin module